MDNAKVPPLYTFIPFSAGERICLGKYLANIEMKTVMSKLIQRYDFKALHPIKMRLKFVYGT